MKLPRLKGKLRKPKTAKGRKSLASRDFFRRQQIESSAESVEQRVHTEQFTEQYT